MRWFTRRGIFVSLRRISDFFGLLLSLCRWLNKNGIASLERFDFPAKLEALYLTENGLSTLKGAIFPATLQYLYVRG